MSAVKGQVKAAVEAAYAAVPAEEITVMAGDAINSTSSYHLRPWHYGLCVCSDDCNSCLESFFCTWCQMSRQYNMLYNLQPAIHIPLFLTLFVATSAFGNVVPWIFLWSLRADLRHRYGIEGGCCGDCTSALLCTPCAVQQQLLEMTSLGAFPGALCYMNTPLEPQML